MIKKFINEYLKTLLPTDFPICIIDQNNISKLDLLMFPTKTYKYIVLNQILENTSDIQSLLENLNDHLTPDGRIIIFYHNYLYAWIKEFIKSIFRTLNNSANWLSTTDIKTFLYLANFELITQQALILFPFDIFLLSSICNKSLLHFFPFNHIAYLLCITARKKQSVLIHDKSVSIIIPARNEEGNIEKIFNSLPRIGNRCEIIFVVGQSKDATKEEIIRCINKYQKASPFTFKVFYQGKQKGKSSAVKIGFEKAVGEILMIFDADLSMKAKELTKFYYAIVSDKGDFINGCRLVYPIEKNAMQFLNILGNKLFSLWFSWILGQPIKDTLCGTKVFWKKDYQKIIQNKSITQVYDPFGDFHLLLGANFAQLKIIDLPVRYYARTYGSTNIQRFRNGWELIKLSLRATYKFKFRL